MTAAVKGLWRFVLPPCEDYGSGAAAKKYPNIY
jgi:hypothetical protein